MRARLPTEGHTNTLENIGLFALLIVLLLIGTYLSNIKILGVFASMLLLIMGIWIAVDGVYIKTGELTGGQSGVFTNNTTNSTTTWTNQTATNLYSKIEIPNLIPSATFGSIVGLACILISMYGMLYFGMKLFASDDH